MKYTTRRRRVREAEADESIRMKNASDLTLHLLKYQTKVLRRETDKLETATKQLKKQIASHAAKPREV